MSFLGLVSVKKSTYRVIMWTIIIILAALSILSLLSYLRSNSVTRQTNRSLERTREEFDAFRKKSLEDELVLRRKLQTEINKRL